MRANLKLVLCLALILCFIIPVLASAQSVPLYTAAAESTITISSKKLTIYNGETAKLKLNGTSKTPTWSSSNVKVAKVSRTGRISAVAPGKANITAKLGKKTYTCKLTVNPAISLSVNSLTIQAEKKAKVEVTYALSGTIYCHCDEEDIVECEWSKKWDGDKTTLFITGLKAGQAKVSVYDTKTKEKYTIKVTVKKKELKGELTGIIDKKIKTINKQLADPVTYYGEDDGYDIYENDYMTVYVDGGKIAAVYLTSRSSKYKLFGVYPGYSYSKAKKLFQGKGFEPDPEYDGWYVVSSKSNLYVGISKKGKYVDTVGYGH